MFVAMTFRITPCSACRPRGSTSLGKSMLRTSTLPGPTYTTPRLPGMLDAPVACSTKGCGAGFRHRLILLTRAAAHANGTDDLPGAFERNAARKDHDAAAVGGMNAVELRTGL